MLQTGADRSRTRTEQQLRSSVLCSPNPGNLRELCQVWVLSSQVDVVSVVFQTTSVGFSTVAVTDVQRAVLTISTFEPDRTTDTEAFVIRDRSASPTSFRRSDAEHHDRCWSCLRRLRYRFYPGSNSKVQAVNQTKEVSVTAGREAVTTLLHEVVRTVGVTTEFWCTHGPFRKLRRKQRRSYDQVVKNLHPGISDLRMPHGSRSCFRSQRCCPI